MSCKNNQIISLEELLLFFKEGKYEKLVVHTPTSKYKSGFSENGNSLINIINDNNNIIIKINSELKRIENKSKLEKIFNEEFTLFYSKDTNKVYMIKKNSLGSYADGFYLLGINKNNLEFISDNANSEALDKECISRKYIITKNYENPNSTKIADYLFNEYVKENNIYKIKSYSKFIRTKVGNLVKSTLFLWSEAKGWTNQDFISFPNKGNQFTDVNVIIPNGNADPKSNINPKFNDIFNPVKTFYKNTPVKAWINIYFGETKSIVQTRINNILSDRSIMSNVIGFSFDLESVPGSDWSLQEAVDYIEGLKYNGKSLKKAWSTGPLSIRKEASPKNLGNTKWDYLWAQYYTVGPPYDEYLYNSTCNPKNNKDFVSGLLQFPNVNSKNIKDVATPVVMLCGGGDCQTTKSLYGYCIDERLCYTWLSNFISSNDYKSFVNDSGINNLAVFYGTYGKLLPPPAGGGQKGCCNQCGGMPCKSSC